MSGGQGMGPERKEFTLRIPLPKLPKKRPRLPKGRLRFLVPILVVAIAGAGVWYFLIRDTGPTQAEIEAQEEKEREAEEAAEEAEALAAAQAEQAACQSQLGGLLTAERELDSLLNGVGLNYDEYGDQVGEISVAYGTIPFKQLSLPCLTEVGTHAEKAMNSWVEAGELWNDCFSDIYCDDGSIEGERQVHWFSASESLRKASAGMVDLGTP